MASEEGQESLTGQRPKAKWGALQRGYVRFFLLLLLPARLEKQYDHIQMWTDMHARCELTLTLFWPWSCSLVFSSLPTTFFGYPHAHSIGNNRSDRIPRIAIESIAIWCWSRASLDNWTIDRLSPTLCSTILATATATTAITTLAVVVIASSPLPSYRSRAHLCNRNQSK